MKEKRKVNLDAYLESNPVFRLAEYAEFQGKSHDLEAIRNQIKYHVRLGRVKHVGMGVYAGVPFGQDPKTFQPDPVLVAVCMRSDAVFSHHTALQLLGVGHSLWYVCTLFCGRPPAPLNDGHTQIQFLAHPRAMVEAARTDLGVQVVELKGYQIRVTGPERTLVDGFRQLRWVGGVEELVTSASGFSSLDLVMLEKILGVYSQRNLWASVGWFLEQYQKRFYVPEDFLGKLASERPRTPRYLVRSDRGGTLAKRWNLIIPDHLLYWEGQRAGTEF